MIVNNCKDRAVSIMQYYLSNFKVLDHIKGLEIQSCEHLCHRICELLYHILDNWYPLIVHFYKRFAVLAFGFDVAFLER